ncbi:DMT family transporter [Utexia brackfieldae]|uniref:DMT family transporter n=1 Tax=Utexia brackfieldae TaxID=3074108 RepID=UPI00370D9944
MAYLYPLIAIIIWAGNAVVNKLSAGAIDPAVISFYRWLLAWLLLTPFILKGVIRQRQQIYPYLGKLFVLGLLGMALYQSLAYYAAYTISVLTIGIMMSVIPLLTILLSLFILRTPPTLGVLIGSLLSFFGLVWLVSHGQPMKLLEMGIGKGELMMFAAALSYALYGVLTKKWALAISSWHSVYMQIIFGALVLLPGFLMAKALTLNSHNIWLVLYAGIPASVIAPFAWIVGVLKLGANKASLFLNLTPVFTAVISVLFLHETLYSYHLIGGSLSLFGVILAQNLKSPLGKPRKVIIDSAPRC